MRVLSCVHTLLYCRGVCELRSLYKVEEILDASIESLNLEGGGGKGVSPIPPFKVEERVEKQVFT